MREAIITDLMEESAVKTLLAASTALIAFGGIAAAADLGPKMATKAPVMAPVPYAGTNWTGCYLGAHVGGGWGRTDFSDPAGTPANIAPAGQAARVNTSGVLGGGQIGCNYEFMPHWVAGIEGDVSAADIKGVADDPFFNGKNFAPRTSWIASATGRLGYSFDSLLFYAKGGGAWAGDHYDSTLLQSTTASAKETRSGWTVGGGLEWALSSNWSTRVEYDHYDFGSRSTVLIDPQARTLNASVKQQIDALTLGVNYRFSASPVVSKY
jgi:outer membrane immunogenic protein